MGGDVQLQHARAREAAFIIDAMHKPTLTSFLTDSGEVVETIYNVDVHNWIRSAQSH